MNQSGQPLRSGCSLVSLFRFTPQRIPLPSLLRWRKMIAGYQQVLSCDISNILYCSLLMIFVLAIYSLTFAIITCISTAIGNSSFTILKQALVSV